MASFTIITNTGQFEMPLPDVLTFTSKGITFRVKTEDICREGWEHLFTNKDGTTGHWHEHFTNGVKSDTDPKTPMPSGSQAHMDYIDGKILGVIGEADIKARSATVPQVVGEMRRIIKRHMLKYMGYKHKDLPLDGVWGRTIDSVTEAAVAVGLTESQCDKARENAEDIVAKDSEGL
jgi:hypothetical protein